MDKMCYFANLLKAICFRYQNINMLKKEKECAVNINSEDSLDK